MLIKDVIQKTTQFFREKGFESPRLDTELLIAEALHWERMKLYLNYEYPLTDAELSACRELVRRRASGEPVAYILGRKGFYKHDFKVTPAVLIPRPETEGIVDEVINWHAKEGGSLRLVDLGSGSGCIGLSIVSAIREALPSTEPHASDENAEITHDTEDAAFSSVTQALDDIRLLGVDVSADAVSVAKENAGQLGLSDTVTFIVSDASALTVEQAQATLGGEVDAVVANPPYIAKDDPNIAPNVRKFEPAGALFSDEHGLAHVRSWATKAAELLRPGGLVMFEIGFEQGRAAKEIFEAVGHFTNLEIVRDLAGHDRFIRGYKSQEN